MPSVAKKPIMLNVFRLSVVRLRNVAPSKLLCLSPVGISSQAKYFLHG
jgi:hypothetical protein